MSAPTDRKYTESHEWARLDGGDIVVGITDFAQGQLGDVVHVELPEVGSDVSAGEACCEIESVKAVSDIYSPVDGEVVAVNEGLDGGEDTVNSDPFGSGWLFRVRPSDKGQLDGLMDAATYDAHAADH